MRWAGLDERLSFYGADVDLGLRLRAAGWNTVAAPRAVAIHSRSATSGHRSRRARESGGWARGFLLRRGGAQKPSRRARGHHGGTRHRRGHRGLARLDSPAVPSQRLEGRGRGATPTHSRERRRPSNRADREPSSSMARKVRGRVSAFYERHERGSDLIYIVLARPDGDVRRELIPGLLAERHSRLPSGCDDGDRLAQGRLRRGADRRSPGSQTLLRTLRQERRRASRHRPRTSSQSSRSHQSELRPARAPRPSHDPGG